MYISYFLCRFHLRLVVNAHPVSSGILAIVLVISALMDLTVKSSLLSKDFVQITSQALAMVDMMVISNQLCHIRPYLHVL